MAKGITIKRDKSLKVSDRKHLPMPTGPFCVVGCRDIMTGASRMTGLLVRLYYPAAHQSRNIRDQYLMWPNWIPHENYRKGYAQVGGFSSNNAMYNLLKWCNGETFIPCVVNAKPLRDGGRKWPLVVFSHGLGGCRTTYSAICLELASHGFVVAAVEHRDASACCTFYAKDVHLSMYGSNAKLTQSECNLNDMREEDDLDDLNGNKAKISETRTFLPQVTIEWLHYTSVKTGDNHYSIRNKQLYQRIRECSRTVDLFEALNAGVEVQNLIDQLLDPSEFEGILDLERITVMGHSMGGATAVLALTSELRFKVGVCLDAWMFPIHKESFESITQPVLFLNTERFQTKENLRKMREVVNPIAKHIRKSTGSSRSESPHPEYNDLVQCLSDRKVCTLKGSVHYNQTDLPFALSWIARKLTRTDSSIDRFTALDLTTGLSLDFIANQLGLSLPVDNGIYLSLHRKKLKEGFPSKL